MEFNDKVKDYIEGSLEETYSLLEALAQIPAPSHHEEKRAAFCKEWLEKQGAKGVYIDDALNVVYPMNCENSDEITVFMAHTDVVFPDTEKLPFSRDEKNFYAPGVGDDTACLVAMLMIVKYIIKNGLKAKKGVLFVANACEEGLGNLKGSRQIADDYSGRIKAFYTIDGRYNAIADKCVGSYRYEIECTTKGGHSFNAFGNKNAILELSKLVCDLCDVEIPHRGDSKTTYNVGLIEGGTSVNTIAQRAKILYEYRSDDVFCINKMTEIFEEKIARAKAAGGDEVKFDVKTVGVRPCGSDEYDRELMDAMIKRVIDVCTKHSGLPCPERSGSTDCNTFMSRGIPSVCFGAYLGGGTHTREEYVEIASLEIGQRITAEIILDYFD